MPEHHMQCACGHAFTISESDYEKVGRCAGCNRNIRIHLMRGEAFIEPVSASGQVLPVFGEATAYSTHTHSMEQRTLNPQAKNDVSLFESDGEADEIHAPKAPIPACARCGKAFRGDWDKRPTVNGVFCYICSTLSIDPPPKANTEKSAHPKKSANDKGLVTLELPPPPSVYETLAAYHNEPSFLRLHWGKFVFAAFAIAAMLCVFILPLDKIIPQLLIPVDVDSYKEHSAQVMNAYMIIGFIVQFFRIFLWIYLGLLISEKLPNEIFHYNAIVVSIYSVGFFILLLPEGMNGRLTFVVQLICVLIIYYAFDLNFWETVKFIIIGAVLKLFVQPITLVLLNIWLLSAR